MQVILGVLLAAGMAVTHFLIDPLDPRGAVTRVLALLVAWLLFAPVRRQLWSRDDPGRNE